LPAGWNAWRREAVGAAIVRYVIQEALSEVGQLAFAYSPDAEKRSG
jgi:hypothetical protein